MSLHIIIAQLNFKVGDIDTNAEKIIAAATTAHEQSADLIVFPELALTGYPPEDLLLRKNFHRAVRQALDHICAHTPAIDMIIGTPLQKDEAMFNAAVLIQQNKITQTYYKHCLPNYGVFDEKRYFTAGRQACVFQCKDIAVGITICEDLWWPEPAKQARDAGASLIICLNASPFDVHKVDDRKQIMQDRIHETGLPIIYAHGVGAQDELVFDGGSMVINSKCEVCYQAPFYEEVLSAINVQSTDSGVDIEKQPLPAPRSLEQRAYDALVLGVRDYAHKNNFRQAILGLSGGIDSALALTIAIDALGKDNVEVIFMPSRYTSQLSTDCANDMITRTGVEHSTISIEHLFTTASDALSERFKDLKEDVTEENIQARCRGILLMAVSNKTNKLVLTTGNKSELAVGYATLYGDMAGGFAVLKDVPKTLVYKLAEYRNNISELIPQDIIDRPPTAELATGQTDQNTLPPYEILDDILQRYIENDESIEEIIAAGFDEAVVKKIITMIYRSEYKRRQAPPGVRITSRAFGRERRYPITSGFLQQTLNQK